MDGHRGHYSDIGQGPPLLIVASMLVLEQTYRRTARLLALGHRVITLELPGSGRASKVSAPWNFEQYAGWLARFLDEVVPGQKVTVIGHSNSGAVATVFAANWPNRVSQLVLADSVGADHANSVVRVLVARGLDAVLEPKLTLSAFHHVVYNALFHTRNFLHQIKLAARSNVLEHAAQVKIPTLLAWGGWDLTMPFRCAKALESAIPSSELYVSKTGSHDWIVTNSKEFAKLIAK